MIVITKVALVLVIVVVVAPLVVAFLGLGAMEVMIYKLIKR